jgi:hypothetical protein
MLFREENGAVLSLHGTNSSVQTKGSLGLLRCRLIYGARRNWVNSCPSDGSGKKGDVASFGLEKMFIG